MLFYRQASVARRRRPAVHGGLGGGPAADDRRRRFYHQSPAGCRRQQAGKPAPATWKPWRTRWMNRAWSMYLVGIWPSKRAAAAGASNRLASLAGTAQVEYAPVWSRPTAAAGERKGEVMRISTAVRAGIPEARPASGAVCAPGAHGVFCAPPVRAAGSLRRRQGGAARPPGRGERLRPGRWQRACTRPRSCPEFIDGFGGALPKTYVAATSSGPVRPDKVAC